MQLFCTKNRRQPGGFHYHIGFLSDFQLFHLIMYTSEIFISCIIVKPECADCIAEILF